MDSASVLQRRGGAWAGPVRFGFLTAVAILAWVGAARAGDTVPASKWISADAVVYAESAHPAAVVLDRTQDARARAILDSVPALRGVLETGGIAKLREAVQVVANKLGKPWDESLRLLTGGGAVFAVEAVQGQEPGLALIVTPTDPAFLRKATETFVELARQDAADHGRPDPIKSGEHRGLTGYQIGPKVTFAVIKDRLVITDRSDTIKAVADRALDGLPAGQTIEDAPAWKAQHGSVTPDTLAWGLLNLERLRKLDPGRFEMPEKHDGGATLLFAGWLETLRKAPWLTATLTWTDKNLAGALAMPALKGAVPAPLKGYVPPKNAGAPALVKVPGQILSASLWRDLGAAWEARAELFRTEEADKLNDLGTGVGQFFGGADFGKDVLAATTTDWRLVVASQDVKTLSPVPDAKLPAFALVFDIKPGHDDLAKQLTGVFQTLVGQANLDATAQGKPALEVRTETLDGIAFETSKFAPPATKDAPKDAPKGAKPPVPVQYNFTPTVAHVGSHFVVSTSLGLARDLVKALGSPAAKPEAATFVAEADGDALARLIGANRATLVQQNMKEKGHDQAHAENEFDTMAALLRYLGHGRLSVKEGGDLWQMNLQFQP